MRNRKVIINGCHGGYGLSALAMKRIAELQGKDCIFVDMVHERKTLSLEEAMKSSWWTAFYNDPSALQEEMHNFYNSTMEKRREMNKRYEDIMVTCFDDDRSNDLLVQVVEELGTKANGSHADLRIVEIPADVEWEISEYDGWETVEEKHRSWG